MTILKISFGVSEKCDFEKKKLFLKEVPTTVGYKNSNIKSNECSILQPYIYILLSYIQFYSQ